MLEESDKFWGLNDEKEDEIKVIKRLLGTSKVRCYLVVFLENVIVMTRAN